MQASRSVSIHILDLETFSRAPSPAPQLCSPNFFDNTHWDVQVNGFWNSDHWRLTVDDFTGNDGTMDTIGTWADGQIYTSVRMTLRNPPGVTGSAVAVIYLEDTEGNEVGNSGTLAIPGVDGETLDITVPITQTTFDIMTIGWSLDLYTQLDIVCMQFIQ